MAENFEHPGHDDPQGGPPPGGDFPKDFFDDPVEPSPAPPTPRDAPVNPPPVSSSAAPAPAPAVSEPAHPAMGPPSAYKAPEYEPMEDEDFKKSPFPAVLGLAMAGALVASWVVDKQKAPAATAATPAAPSTVVAATPTPAPAQPPVTTAETDALEGKIKDLAGKVDELTAQVKAFEGKLNDLPKPEPAPDLKPLEGKVDELGKSVAAVSPLNDKVSKLGERVGSVDGALKSIQGDIAALKEQVKKPAPAPTGSEPKPAEDETAAAMTGGVDLFKAGKYKEAADVFNKLASANAKDARVYYYAALSRGVSTNDWKGETLTTAAKGAELEKAGSPKAPEIDATFADLPATLKPWVAYFRQQAK